ncbi:MAG TPA: hypothetical protein VFE45_10520 [Coriobacteriia bacterium]|nr:hypothetical protein [Coriobacteriia bacterium]
MNDPIRNVSAPGVAPRSLPRRLVGWLLLVILLAALALGAVRFFIPTISPDQQQPPGHYFAPCAACHLTVAGAEFVDVE